MPTANVRILIVDDDQDDLRLISDYLSEASRTRFTTEEAETGEFAKTLIKRNRYDVILLDYRLPDLTGLTLMKWLQDNHFKIPVILITSHGDRELQNRALDEGFAEYLEKGTFSADLLERTCLYAIGLNERIVRDDSGTAGVGLLISELVGLTRESVTAQTRVVTEISELRKSQEDGLKEIYAKVEGLQEGQVQSRDKLLEEIRKDESIYARIKEAITWGTQHPIASFVLIFLFILLMVLAVLLLQVLDTEKLKDLKELKEGASSLEQVTRPLFRG